MSSWLPTIHVSSQAAGCGGAICANSSRSSAASAWRCCLQRKVARSCKHFTSTKLNPPRNHQTKTKRLPWYWRIIHERGGRPHGLSMFKWSKKHEACNGLEEGGEIIVAIIRRSCSSDSIRKGSSDTSSSKNQCRRYVWSWYMLRTCLFWRWIPSRTMVGRTL